MWIQGKTTIIKASNHRFMHDLIQQMSFERNNDVCLKKVHQETTLRHFISEVSANIHPSCMHT